jgi:hypothetical protein
MGWLKMAEPERYQSSNGRVNNPIIANWSSNVFFFIGLSFLLYVIAVGDAPKWKQVLSGKITAINSVSTANTSATSSFGR